MQPPDRFNNAIQQPLHLVTQPRASQDSSDQINKLNYYDIGVSIFLFPNNNKS